MNKLFSEENKVPRTQFEARKLAGSATYVVKWMKMFILKKKKKICITLLLKISTLKLYSALF